MSNNNDNKILADLRESLERLHLSPHAAEVYLALFETGETGIARLTLATGLHRQSIYNALKELEDVDLVMHILLRGNRRFTARPPKKLIALADQGRRDAERVADQIAKHYPEMSQYFQIFEGREAFVEHQMATLREACEGERLDLIGSVWEQFFETMGRKAFEDFERIRKARGIAIRYLGLETQRSVLAEAERRRPLFEYRILPGYYTGLVNTSIWDRSIVYNFFGAPVVAFVLENEEVAQSQRIFFEALWKLGTR